MYKVLFKFACFSIAGCFIGIVFTGDPQLFFKIILAILLMFLAAIVASIADAI